MALVCLRQENGRGMEASGLWFVVVGSVAAVGTCCVQVHGRRVACVDWLAFLLDLFIGVSASCCCWLSLEFLGRRDK